MNAAAFLLEILCLALLELVDFLNKVIYVDAVYHACLLEGLSLCGGTSDTMHSGTHKNLYNVEIGTNDVADLHIFCDDHDYAPFLRP